MKIVGLSLLNNVSIFTEIVRHFYVTGITKTSYDLLET